MWIRNPSHSGHLQSLASFHLDAWRCHEPPPSWLSDTGGLMRCVLGVGLLKSMVAGHNKRLQKMAFAFCWVLARRQPWLRFHCTAAAGRGIMMRASDLAGPLLKRKSLA
jgi:hypothetical protein